MSKVVKWLRTLPMELEEPEPQQMQACYLYWCQIPLHRDLSHSHFGELSAKTLEKCQILGVPFMLSLVFVMTNNFFSFGDILWGNSLKQASEVSIMARKVE